MRDFILIFMLGTFLGAFTVNTFIVWDYIEAHSSKECIERTKQWEKRRKNIINER